MGMGAWILVAIVVALALGTATIHMVQPLYQMALVLVLAYALLFLPRALVNLRTGMDTRLAGLARGRVASPGV